MSGGDMRSVLYDVVRIFAAVIATLVLLCGVSHAQTPTAIVVNYNTAKLTWTWTKGAPANDGDATEFRVKCGAASGQYTITKVLADPAARSVAVSAVVTQVGQYYCAVSAANQFGESGLSNEVFFLAGKMPANPQ